MLHFPLLLPPPPSSLLLLSDFKIMSLSSADTSDCQDLDWPWVGQEDPLFCQQSVDTSPPVDPSFATARPASHSTEFNVLSSSTLRTTATTTTARPLVSTGLVFHNDNSAIPARGIGFAALGLAVNARLQQPSVLSPWSRNLAIGEPGSLHPDTESAKV
jgi:hypothetical protein